MVVLLGPGQGSDSRMFTNLLDAIRVPRVGPGRPRTTPTAVMADKAYSSLDPAELAAFDTTARMTATQDHARASVN